VCSWILLVSIHNRNPMILNGGDVLFRCLYLWAMLLPLGARWSIDAALRQDEPPASNTLFSGASIAITLQVAMVYWSTAALKTGREWWPEGSASYYALSLDQFTTTFGAWMQQWTEFLRISTLGVYLLELTSPFLMFCPIYFAPVRTLVLLALAGLHFNFDLSMRLGLFPWIDIVSLVALVPGDLIDQIAVRLRTPARLGLKLYYDKDCGFCRKAVLILRELLLLPETKIEPAQDTPEIAKVMTAEHSWVVADAAGQLHLRWDGMVTLLEHSPYVGWLVKRLPLRALSGIGDAAYRTVAGNRSFFGKLTARFLPYRDMGSPQAHWLTSVVALLLIAYTGLWNLKTIPRTGVDIPQPWNKIASILRLDQKWNMFAPYPLRDDGWYIIDGTLQSGEKIDVFKSLWGEKQPLTRDKPEQVSAAYENARWRKYMMNIWQKSKKDHRLWYGKYVCRTWNDAHEGGDRLATFDIIFMREKTPPPGSPLHVEPVTIWQHDCFKRASDSSEGSLPAPTPTATPAPDTTAPSSAPAATPAPASDAGAQEPDDPS
jgi:predicted DCC family thiol-disulfide oxidoreductase YuxK